MLMYTLEEKLTGKVIKRPLDIGQEMCGCERGPIGPYSVWTGGVNFGHPEYVSSCALCKMEQDRAFEAELEGE